MNTDRAVAALGDMTDLASPAGPAAAVRPGATTSIEDAAVAAAGAAGVEVVLLDDMARLEQADQLFVDIWDPDNAQPLVSSHLMRALAHAGGYVAGALDATVPGRAMVGASVGFFGRPAEGLLHSHIAGVAPGAGGRHIGYALKLHQHAWAHQQGARSITWTFDPLVRRNAYFNLAKLGVQVTAYLPEFYGEMVDGINAGQGSDRLYVTWEVRSRLDTRRRDAAPAGVVLVLSEGADGRPVLGRLEALGDRPALVTVPADVEALRRGDPARARAWRSAVRDTLGELLASGRQVSAFTRTGGYVVTP